MHKRQDFVIAAILANCQGCKIEDKVEGTVSEQVEIKLGWIVL